MFTVEETLGTLCARPHDGVSIPDDRNANPAARDVLWELLEAEELLGEFHIFDSRIWEVMGFIGETEDIARIDRWFSARRGVLSAEECRSAWYIFFRCLRVMAVRGVDGAQAKLRAMAHPDYWQDMEFQWRGQKSLSRFPYERYRGVWEAVRAYAEIGAGDVDEVVNTAIASVDKMCVPHEFREDVRRNSMARNSDTNKWIRGPRVKNSPEDLAVLRSDYRTIVLPALAALGCIGNVGDARRASEWSFDAAEAVRRQQKAAEALRTDVRKELDLGEGVKMRLAVIPAGQFVMGSPPTEFSLREESFSDEEQHMVRITKAFYIGVTEVTQEQYERIMDVNPSHKEYGWGPTMPVTSVTWDDAQEFCRRLGNAVEGEVRLPTEAEWEYACRAGTAGPYHVSRQVWKEIVSSMDPPGRSAPAAVATKRPNAWGLYDMHGNVFEWCQDWYDWTYYRRSPEEDPTGPSHGKYRVLRSGSWFVLAEACRSAKRCFDTPDGKDWGEYSRFQPGFRVVMSLE